MSSDWHLWRNEQKRGPYPQERFQQMLDDGTVGPSDIVWYVGFEDCLPLLGSELAPPHGDTIC